MTASSARDFSASSTAASHSATIELVESPSLVYCWLAMLVVISCRLRVSSASFLRRSPVLLRLAAMLGRSEHVAALGGRRLESFGRRNARVETADRMELLDELRIVVEGLQPFELLFDRLAQFLGALEVEQDLLVAQFVVARVGKNLRELEDSLRDYNVEHKVINYDEQTKHIAALSRS